LISRPVDRETYIIVAFSAACVLGAKQRTAYRAEADAVDAGRQESDQDPLELPQIDHTTQYWMQFINLSTG
jgi:hypothetical protein